MPGLGKIIIYCGKGEGKTSAALGRVIRMAGYGKKVIVLEFMKGRETGEYKFLKKSQNKKFFLIEVYLAGPKKFLTEKNYPLYLKKTQEGLKLAQKIISEKKCHLLVLDEILYALKFKLLKEKDILDLLKKRGKINIILTGRFAVSKNLKEIADQITRMDKIKHYFDKKQKAIKGLEY